MVRCTPLAFAWASIFINAVAGDPVDWVNVNLNKKGPWTIMSGDITPPSKDKKDYLSWAPYHWPDCNWCPNPRQHLNNPSAPNTDHQDDGADDGLSRPDYYSGDFYFSEVDEEAPNETHLQTTNGRMQRRRRSSIPQELSGSDDQAQVPLETSVALPIVTSSVIGLPSTSTKTESATGTPGPAGAAAKTGTKTSKQSCTPSPTKSLAPSATWTRCPYVVRDGKVNPDVRKLKGPPSIQSVSQATLFNALASQFSSSASSSSSYIQNVNNFINVFFLDPKTAMNPNVNFGQMVRGPGDQGQKGTFTGILDIRGIVKIVNALLILRTGVRKGSDISQGEDDMQAVDGAMRGWVSQPNNHGSFFTAQLAATQIFLGDKTGANQTLTSFFDGSFLDQIASSGEQPMECVRTRPWHYRNFNLEALITNAKLGDQLGTNFWTHKSKYGATIQTAVDYTMGLDPGKEDPSELVPHVAAVAAAYGDPSGKYQNFMKKYQPEYKQKSFWFYDQSNALPNSPAGKASSGEGTVEEADVSGHTADEFVPFACPEQFVYAPFGKIEFDDGLFFSCAEISPFY
ncbi:dermatan-sulfate isomerase family protein [Pleurotus pulmonarius]